MSYSRKPVNGTGKSMSLPCEICNRDDIPTKEYNFNMVREIFDLDLMKYIPNPALKRIRICATDYNLYLKVKKILTKKYNREPEIDVIVEKTKLYRKNTPINLSNDILSMK